MTHYFLTVKMTGRKPCYTRVQITIHQTGFTTSLQPLDLHMELYNISVLQFISRASQKCDLHLEEQDLSVSVSLPFFCLLCMYVMAHLIIFALNSMPTFSSIPFLKVCDHRCENENRKILHEGKNKDCCREGKSVC